MSNEKGFTKELVTRIKEALAFSKIELPVKEVVKLEDVKLIDGSMLSVDKMEVGAMATFTGADGVAIPANGEFELEDGSSIICVAGAVTEIKPKESAADPVVEPAAPSMDMAAIITRLEALEAKYKNSTSNLEAQLSETKKHLGTALEAIDNVSKKSVAINLEAQKETKKVKLYEDMTNHEKMLFNKGKL